MRLSIKYPSNSGLAMTPTEPEKIRADAILPVTSVIFSCVQAKSVGNKTAEVKPVKDMDTHIRTVCVKMTHSNHVTRVAKVTKYAITIKVVVCTYLCTKATMRLPSP